jgi:hypothetical protein
VHLDRRAHEGRSSLLFPPGEEIIALPYITRVIGLETASSTSRRTAAKVLGTAIAELTARPPGPHSGPSRRPG